MDFSKMPAFLIMLMISISSTPFALACGTCKPPRKSGKGNTPTIGLPPVTLPPVTLPPVTLPPVVTNPPVKLPPVVTNPPVKLPPVVVNPPVQLPPVTLPPVTLPPVTLPPVVTPPTVGKPGCAPPAKKKTCPVDTLKLNGCVDLLGGLVHLNIGKATSTCCPLLEGLAGVDAALCLCTTIKAKLLNINVALPIALELLISCGKTPPSGFTCA